MKKKIIKICFLSLIVFNSCINDDSLSKEEQIIIAENQKEPLSNKEISNKLLFRVKTGEKFNWNMATAYEVWSAIQNGNKVCTIGFGNNKNEFDRKKTANQEQIQSQLLNIIAKYEEKEIEKILLNKDPYLNLIDVYIEKQETIIALKRLGYVRYIEPGDFKLETTPDPRSKDSSSSSGCGLESELISSTDYTTITPNAKVPWAFYNHNIPSAWQYSTGKGITLAIVDTGASTVNSLLNENFNNGNSTGRTIQKYGVYVNSIWPWSTGYDGVNDQCGHGTSMSSVAASPRNDKGQPVGVAYNCNLVTYRAASNVVLDGYQELEGVKKAFTDLGNNPSVRVISMSMGNIISSSKIEDGIRYAYSKGKLIFCAAGTSTDFTSSYGVIFPAWMAETVAVTGLKESSSYQACDVCHSGSKVEFAIMMQRNNTGNKIPVNSYYDGQGDYVGGSSVATATTAGIATLIWAKNPTWTRDQVLNKLRQSSAFYGNKHPEFGYGMPDALKAVQ
ncbi:Subtilisin BL [Flavobacterium columnare]|uniref:S8/S53 family peptidase n=2 Tax=Flavobacterium TaxID=237 RepID=A0ABW8PPX0_9FLAO|nr:S8/S53 family peptidase [Flavobacterium columnare]SPE76141.1 Subtilisin BL [Flavobacterium columnare]